jgi:hypothetical protein
VVLGLSFETVLLDSAAATMRAAHPELALTGEVMLPISGELRARDVGLEYLPDGAIIEHHMSRRLVLRLSDGTDVALVACQ